MKKAVKLIPRSYYKLLFALLILMCLGAKESMSAEDNTTENVPKKKSYILAGAGALLCPALGHSYIGGDNVRRGLWYTASEVVAGYFTVAYSFGGMYGDAINRKLSRSYGMFSIATHAISAIDALISVQKINSNNPTKSYFIATAGSAVLPVIGHGYISPKNHKRGWFYTIVQIILSRQSLGNDDFRGVIRYISMLDAFGSTYKFNESYTNVTIMPGKSSLKFMITKTF